MNRSLLVHGIASVSLGVAVALFFQSNAFSACCASTPWLQAIFLPAILGAMFVGGGVHSTGELLISTFIVVQVAAMWFLARLLLAAFKRRRHAA